MARSIEIVQVHDNEYDIIINGILVNCGYLDYEAKVEVEELKELPDDIFEEVINSIESK